MWLLIIPVVILVIILLSMSAVVGAVFGVLGGNWPWLLILAGAWMFWHSDGRHHRHGRNRHAWTPRTVPPTTTQSARVDQQPKRPAATKAAAAQLKAVPQPELPIDVQVKVEQIRRKVEVLLGFADRFPPFSKDLFLVRQTASEYLPRTINNYLALPPLAAERPLATGGQTPHQELKAQLDLLDAKLDDIASDLERQDVERLLANRQFLEERFGKATA
jgi:hypothetical protein